MKIDSINIKSLHIPFKVSFKHTSAERKKTQSILVVASSSGINGYGEGCPREYVTNESIASALSFFSEYEHEFLSITSLSKLKVWATENEAVIDLNPAAWCAIELALLDLLSKLDNKSIESFLGLPELKGIFQYTAIIGEADVEKTTSYVKQYAALGFSDFKIKITGDHELDNQKLSIIGDHVKQDYRLRLDANNLWKGPEEVIAYLRKITPPIFAIEEPIQASDIKGLDKIIEDTGIKVILDESFLNTNDFELLKDKHNFIINLRISKMGGLLRSLTIAALAAKNKIPLVIGAQVGETSILTRAALTVANIHSTNLIAQEGAFGTMLLEKDIVSPTICFSQMGKVDTNQLHPTDLGFGLVIDAVYLA